MATNSLNFIRFNMQENWSTEELSKRIISEHLDQEDRFILNEVTDTVVDGCYITHFMSKELVYNVEFNILENKLVKKSQIISFSIDISNKIIDIWGSKSNVNKIITQLGIRFEHKIAIELMKINLAKIVEDLDKYDAKIGKVRIENYLFENNIVASCTFDLLGYAHSLDIVRKYAKELSLITLSISDNRQSALTIMIYGSGSVVVYKAKDEITLETLEIIRKICTGQGED